MYKMLTQVNATTRILLKIIRAEKQFRRSHIHGSAAVHHFQAHFTQHCCSLGLTFWKRKKTLTSHSFWCSRSVGAVGYCRLKTEKIRSCSFVLCREQICLTKLKMSLISSFVQIVTCNHLRTAFCHNIPDTGSSVWGTSGQTAMNCTCKNVKESRKPLGAHFVVVWQILSIDMCNAWSLFLQRVLTFSGN